MYESILSLPYFQGISRNDLTSILDKVKFQFSQFKKGEKIISKEDKCEHFHILINGELRAEGIASDESYKLSEIHKDNYAIEPYSLFGASTSFERTYYAHTDCNILSIHKRYFFSDLVRHNIFILNFLNLISLRAQCLHKETWSNNPPTIAGRIAHFIEQRSESTVGEKTLYIKMERLGQLLGETRINISRTLNTLQEMGVVELRRKEIFIPDFEKFYAATKEIK